MKQRFILLFTIVLALQLQVKAQQKYIAEEIIAMVGNNPISLSELYETTNRLIDYRKQTGVSSTLEPAEEAFELLLNQKLMLTFARMDSLDKDMPIRHEEIEKKINEMIQKYGSVAALEKAIGKPVFQMREDYKKDVMDSFLGEMKEQKLRDQVRITYPEVKSFFDTLNMEGVQMLPPQISYSQIVKMPPATDDRKLEVRQRMLEFRQQILNGQKLSVLATMYSHDPGSRGQGGLYQSTYEGSDPAFSDAIRVLEPGQISEIIEGEFGYHLIEVVSKNKDGFVARHILLKPEFTVAESEKVVQELDSIAQAVRDGKTTFAEAALRDSDDKKTRLNGGATFNTSLLKYTMTRDLSRTSRYFVIDEIQMPMDVRVLNRLKVGEISEPYESMDEQGNKVYKIVTITDVIPTHKVSMEHDYNLIYIRALQDKQDRILTQWLKESIGKVFININDEYRNYRLKNKEWFEQSDKCKAENEPK